MTTEFEVEGTKKKRAPVKTGSKNLGDLYDGLMHEFQKGIMPERKKVALLKKLVGLFYSEQLDEKEEVLLRTIFTHDRLVGALSEPNADILHKIEMKDCELECYVKTDEAPAVLKLTKDKVCKFRFDPTPRKDRRPRYIVFVPDTVPPTWQMDMATARQDANGHPIDTSKLPPERTIIRRIEVTPKEFDRWFGHNDEELINTKTVEEIEYKF